MLRDSTRKASDFSGQAANINNPCGNHKSGHNTADSERKGSSPSVGDSVGPGDKKGVTWPKAWAFLLPQVEKILIQKL